MEFLIAFGQGILKLFGVTPHNTAAYEKIGSRFGGDIPEAEVRCTCTINKEYKKEIGLDEERYYNDNDNSDLSIEALQHKIDKSELLKVMTEEQFNRIIFIFDPNQIKEKLPLTFDNNQIWLDAKTTKEANQETKNVYGNITLTNIKLQYFKKYIIDLNIEQFKKTNDNKFIFVNNPVKPKIRVIFTSLNNQKDFCKIKYQSIDEFKKYEEDAYNYFVNYFNQF